MPGRADAGGVQFRGAAGDALVWCVSHEQWRPLSSCKSRDFVRGKMTHECIAAKRCRPVEDAEESGTLRERKRARKEATGGAPAPEG